MLSPDCAILSLLSNRAVCRASGIGPPATLGAVLQNAVRPWHRATDKKPSAVMLGAF